jgi:uncharacterized protein YhaN
MRLRRLDLTRFGHFTDFSLDFGSRETGKPDLHIIFGPNEAGKTTAFEGYLDLLFGIPTRSKYNFLHDYENMRVGAVLDVDSESVELIRIKRNKNDLITPTDAVANPGVLIHALNGIDRDQYRAMFSLDDETIEAGGDDILASQGSLGELLFSAAAGLSDLGSVLDAARADIDRFHRKKASKTELAEAKRNLKELHDQIRDLDVIASTFRKLKSDRDTAKGLLDEATQARDELQTERVRVEAMIECIPLQQSLCSIRGDLDKHDAYPALPDGWAEEAKELKQKEVVAQTELKGATRELEDEQKAQDGLEIDTRMFEIADELKVLLDTPKSRAQTAEEDLPKRKTELELLLQEIDRLAKELELEQPQDGILPEGRLEQLEGVAAKYADIKKQLKVAQREHSDAVGKLDDLTANENEEDEAAPTSSDDLEQQLADLEPERRIAELAKCNEDLLAAERSLQKALDKLRPWTGDPIALKNVYLAEEEAQRIAARWADLKERMGAAKKADEEAELEHNRLKARLAEFEKDDVASVDDEAKQARSERNDLWQKHRAALNDETAMAFQTALEKDDAFQEARLGFAEKLAHLRELQLNVASSTSDRETRASQLKEVAEALEAEKASLQALYLKLGLPETYDPRDLPKWQVNLSEAEDCLQELEIARDHNLKAQQAVDDATSRLREALAQSVDMSDLRELAKRARAKVGEVAKAKAAAGAREEVLKNAREEVQRRYDETKRLSQELASIQATWEAEVSGMAAPLKTLDAFEWKISTLRKLASKDAERSKIEHRIVAMKQDLETFESEIAKLAERVAEPSAVKPLVLAERLSRRLAEAETRRDEYHVHNEKIEKVTRALRAAEADLEAIKSRTAEMAEAFSGVCEIANVDELTEAISQSAKAGDLRLKLEELRQRILQRLGVSDLEAAEHLLADQDKLKLEAQLRTIKQDLKGAEDDCLAKAGDLRAAKDALERVGGDDAPARLEEKRQTLLLDVEERAKAALRLRLGVLAAEQALLTYRDHHRSQMLADTETAFSTLTAGEYQAIRTQTDGQKEVLLALRKRDGRSVSVSEMSKGTRFQLYLALRLAGYLQYTGGGTTLPFVADDIMETFDNTRTMAALGLLREISARGQALYFTHHEHVVDLARNVCGDDLTVHELSRAM